MENKNPIRILHYIGSLSIGGSQTMIMEIYRHIDRNKVQFDFIVDKKDNMFFKDEVESLGGKVYLLNSFNGFNYFKYVKQLKEFFKNHREYKIIHGHVRSIAAIYLKIAKKFGLITISHSHNTSNGTGFSAFVKNLIQYKIRYISDYFAGCSYEANLWLYGKKVANSDKCFIINNAIDYNKFKFNSKNREIIRKKYYINNNEILLGNVGRFIEQKNQKYLIDVLFNLLKNSKQFKLMLCGYGNLKEELVNYAKSKDVLDNVIFVSPNDEVYKYYSAFDVFLFPSKYEGLGIVAVEAQVSGLPIILSNVIPKSVIISKRYKFLDTNESSIDEWKKYIIDFTKNMDICDRNSKVNSKYDIETEAKKIEKLYLDIFKLKVLRK